MIIVFVEFHEEYYGINSFLSVPENKTLNYFDLLRSKFKKVYNGAKTPKPQNPKTPRENLLELTALDLLKAIKVLNKMAEDNPHVVASQFTLKTFFASVLAGGIAGTSIDFALFPIDSIKTRMQATSTKVDFVK